MKEKVHEPCPVCGRYNNRGVTVDAIIVNAGKILLIKRGNEPFMGMWGLPGGHVDWNEEVKDSLKREVREETGMFVEQARLLDVYSKPERDPVQKITLAYIVQASGTAKAGDDADDIGWYDLERMPTLASDHKRIIDDYILSKEEGL